MDQHAPMHLTAQSVARALGGQVSGRDRVLAPGPGHSRKDRSLSIKIDPSAADGFVVHAFAGEDWRVARDYVLGRLGLPTWEPGHAANDPVANMVASARRAAKPEPGPADRYDESGLLRTGYSVAATYDYFDGDKPLYQVVRYEHPAQPKRFKARHLDAHGHWLKGAGTEQRVLYRAADLDLDPEAIVLITEGEKDADRLAGLGFVAVTVAFGTWSDDAVELLAGRRCIVLEDNDVAGRTKATKVLEALQGVAASATVLRLDGLAEGQDVSNWLDAGHSGPELRTIVTGLVPEMPRAIVEATPFVLRAPTEIPRRRFIYGTHYARGFISTTIAPGGVGKTTLGTAEGLAMATGRSLLGVRPWQQCKVWMFNGEDPLEEIERRVAATCLHYGISATDIAGQLFVDSGRNTEIIIARSERSGVILMEPVRAALLQTVRANAIDVVIVDPFVSTHHVNENDNMAINAVVKAWARIADEAGVAVELVHHARKTGGNEVTVEDGRGAVALLAAARSARVLNAMTSDQAKEVGVEARRTYFRAENGKSNMSPPPERADWFHLVSVPLDNGDGPLDPGDQVAVATSWEWPDATKGVMAADYEAVARAIQAGEWRADVQSADWVGKAVAEAMSLDIDNPADKGTVKACLKMWFGSGALRVVEGFDKQRRPRKFVRVREDCDASA